MFAGICWTKVLTPHTFSPYIRVIIEHDGFAKWLKILLWTISKNLSSLTNDDCGFQMAALDDIYSASIQSR